MEQYGGVTSRIVVISKGKAAQRPVLFSKGVV